MTTNAALNYDAGFKQQNWTPTARPTTLPPLARAPVVKPSFKLPAFPQLNQISSELLLSMPRDVFAALQPEMRHVNFSRGQAIYNANDALDYVYFPNNLVASRLAIMEDGAMIEVGIIGREGMLGAAALMGAKTANNTTIAEIDGSAIRVRAKVLNEAFRANHKLQSLLLGYYHDFLTQISQRAACRCRHSVAQQLCSWLLQVHDRASGNDLTLTQETVANRLGARRASITVAINELEKAGLLQCKRGHILICNRAGLEAAACECYLQLSYGFDNRYQSNLIQ